MRISRPLLPLAVRTGSPRTGWALVAWALALLCAALGPMGPAHADAGSAGRWVWPLPPPHPVLTGFDASAGRYGPGSRGIDIGGAGVVTAVEAGTVHFAGMVAGRPVLSIMHADGLLSTYEPVLASVSRGDVVVAGQEIGTVATADAAGTGAQRCGGAPCLHLGARRGVDYLDPLTLLGARGPSVLKPWGGSSMPGAQGSSPSLSGRAAAGSVAQAAQGAQAVGSGSASAAGAACDRGSCARVRLLDGLAEPFG